MIKFFRNIRQNMLLENKTGKYLKYAIGEIILVVVGILIALQINNWNEERQLNSQFQSILRSVREDLKTDTLMAAQVIIYYDTVNKYSNKVMRKEFNLKSLDSCPICPSLITVYKPMTIQKKGYQQLQNFNDYNIRTDTLATQITQFYAIFDDLIMSNMQMVKKEVIENLDYFKKQDWFINWMQGKEDPRVGEYFGNSLDFKNRVASHNILAAQNHHRVIKIYKEQASKLIEEIDKHLNDD